MWTTRSSRTSSRRIRRPGPGGPRPSHTAYASEPSKRFIYNRLPTRVQSIRFVAFFRFLYINGIMPTSVGDPAISSKSLGEEIVDELQREIIRGGFRPGQRLVERELIRRFGVSSIPVREALQELENRGL